ncbi:MAG: glycosyltransferase family 4 protein [Bacteroidaceae bacterium]|nr:glycosyltransferase family 4 protein [Bacteroidaceae bacterium]
MNRGIVVHPTGNANVRAVLDGFSSHGLLGEFHTTVGCVPGNVFCRLSDFPGMSMLKRRGYSSEIASALKMHPWRELGRIFAQKAHLSSMIGHERGIFSVDKIYQNIDKYSKNALLNKDFSFVYGYEDGIESTFAEAKKVKIPCFYDLPIGYWRAMRECLSPEMEKNPDWNPTLGGFDDSDAKLRRKDNELAMADVIYVASSFTKKTLELYPGKLAPVEVVPYGFPEVNRNREYSSPHGRKIRLLYVGGLSQRKGLSYMFDAIEGLERHVELTVVGLGNIGGTPILKSKLQKCNYIPSLSHENVLSLMAQSDVLLFPSLFEGFGLVVTEAMSQGTPVITTERTCGPDIIESGSDGWLVNAANSAPIRERIEDIILHPEMLAQVGKSAMNTAAGRPWNVYSEAMAKSVEKHLKEWNLE